jgi:hypothetical protein
MEWHGLHDDVREQAPTVELRRLLATADEITDVVFDPGVVGHLWAFRELPPGHDQRQEHPAAPELRDEDEAPGSRSCSGEG